MPVTAVRDEGALRMWVHRLPVHIVPAEQAVFMKDYGKFATFLGPMCTGKRQTHIRNAPSSRTAVTGIVPYNQTGRVSA